MTPERWQRLKEVFEDTLERPVRERDSYLESTCGDDPDLVAQVRKLLIQSDTSDGFLEHPLSILEILLPGSPPADSVKVGDILCDRFEILRFIARGGMGEVYEAYDAELRERVALKTIRPDIASDQRVIDQFKGEVRRARSIASEHVCRVYDFFTHRTPDGTAVVFLTMQLLVGETLTERAQRHGRMSSAEALPLLRAIAQGLQAAHNKQIVHGDLKSRNIMLVRKEDGTLSAVITDFGLARPATQLSPVRDADLGLGLLGHGGTPAYMSPEQMEGKPATTASDIYALGLVAYEMITGRLPVKGAAAPPRSFVPDLPQHWDAAILRCLERNPANRFPAASQFSDALETAVASRTVFLNRMFVVLILIVIAGLAWLSSSSRLSTSGSPSARSLAVLPFDELDPAAQGQYFADGFTEELTHALTRVPGLRVMGRDSSFRFRNTKLAPREIGSQLGVRFLLSGTIRRSGGRLRIIARVVNAAEGFQVWSRNFEGEERDLLDLQNRMAQQVTGALEVKLAAMQAAAEPLVVPDMGARDLYWMGRFHWRRRTDSSVRLSLEYFTKAVQRDPRYALAYAGMADAYCVMAEQNLIPPAEALARARDAALTAIGLDSKLADAYASLGQISSLYDRDFDQAERHFTRALSLNGNLATAHQWFSYMLVKEHRFDEAVRHSLKALEIDPLSLPANINLAVQYFYIGDYNAAVQQCRKLDQLEPSLIFTRLMTAHMLARQGRHAEAVRVMEEVRQRADNHSLTLRTVGEVSALAGRRREAEEALQGLIAERQAGGVPASYIAIVCAALGNRDQAFEWLDRAYSEYDGFLSTLDIYPEFEALRSDARYPVLLRRLGIRRRTGSDSTRLR